MFEKDIFPSLLRNHTPVYSYIPSKHYWIDIGTPTSFLTANLDFINKKTTLFSSNSENGDLVIPASTRINKQSVVGYGCKIEPKVSIANSVIGENCQISKGVYIRNSVIFSNCVISTDTRIDSSIISYSCRIGKGCLITNSIIGDKSHITNYTILNKLL
jgi:NDP-sugar pyrophosphorylase family protein